MIICTDGHIIYILINKIGASTMHRMPFEEKSHAEGVIHGDTSCLSIKRRPFF